MATGLTVKVMPHRAGLAYGNIVWTSDRRKFAMRAGKFPASHPVAPGLAFPAEKDSYGFSQLGRSHVLNAFRDRGYWASCFPEGDGITWEPKHGQTEAQCFRDIREVFGALGWRFVIPEETPPAPRELAGEAEARG